jgi:hypothetical protein
MTKWKHKRISADTLDYIEEEVRLLGMDGWQLVQMMERAELLGGTRWWAWLKREVGE